MATRILIDDFALACAPSEAIILPLEDLDKHSVFVRISWRMTCNDEVITHMKRLFLNTLSSQFLGAAPLQRPNPFVMISLAYQNVGVRVAEDEPYNFPFKVGCFFHLILRAGVVAVRWNGERDEYQQHEQCVSQHEASLSNTSKVRHMVD